MNRHIEVRDIGITRIELMMLEYMVIEDDVALRGLEIAYEQALAERYPDKQI